MIYEVMLYLFHWHFIHSWNYICILYWKMDSIDRDGSVSYGYSHMSTQYFISFSLTNISQLVL